MRSLTAAVLGVALAGCATPMGESPVSAASSLRPGEIRQPALVVRVSVGPELSERERGSLPGEYEGALLDAFNARALLTRDVRSIPPDQKLDPRAALARAGELSADHVILVDVRVARGETIVCRDSRRPFRAAVTTWSQRMEVLRTADGAVRLSVPAGGALDVADLEADCERPRESRRRSSSDAIAEAADRVVARVLKP